MLNIYKASAGSGKTFTLAREYIKMVLGIEDNETGRWHLNTALLAGRHTINHRRILAITFTNKATEEMKVRIIGNLDALSRIKTVKGHPYAQTLSEQLDCTVDQLALAARNAMTSLLLDFSFFNVSTIDSFFQTIMRTFARELDKQGDYNITIDTEIAIRDALNLLLDALNTSHPTDKKRLEYKVHKWLNDFVSRSTSDKAGNKFSPFQRNSNTYKDLVKIVKAIFTEQFKPLQQALRTYLDNPTNLQRFDAELTRIKNDAVCTLNKAGLDVLSNIESLGYKANANFVNAVNKIGSGIFFKSKEIPTSYMAVALGNPDMVELKKYVTGLGKNPATTDLETCIGDWFETSAAALRRHSIVSAIETNIHALEFIGLMMSYLDRLREQNNMLILDDTASYIKRIIDGSNIPFIYEHLGTQFRNFLIDEFQDTSRMQWDNIRPLVQNGCDSGDDSLIIGDTKQAIYRFRNSDSTILGHTLTANDFPNPTTRSIKGNNPEDNTNYRTAHPIVKLNNAIIPALASNVFGIRTYLPGYTPADAVQSCAKTTLPLPSRVKFIPFNKKFDDKIEATGLETNPIEIDNLLTQTEPFDGNKRIDHIIAEIIDQHNRGYNWGDIAILIRWNKSSTPIVKEMLKRGIPIRSGESLYLKNAPSVRLILSFLQLIARAGIPDAPIYGRSEQNPKTQTEARMEQTLFEARYDYFIHAHGCDPQQAISLALDPRTDDGAPVDADINHAIESILGEHPATLVAIIESIIEKGLVRQSTIETEHDYVAAFEDIALKYGEEYDNDLNGFLSWWTLHGDRCTVPPPPNADAVSIMTIHKAKGLEFKCVHLADFEWDTISNKEKIWLDVRPDSPTNTYGIHLGLDIDPELIPPLMLYAIPGDVSKATNLPFLPVVVDQIEKMQLDALNMAYVALTRPVNELTAYYLLPDKQNNGPAANIAEALCRSLNQLAQVPAADNGTSTDITPEIFNPSICALAFERDGIENTEDKTSDEDDRDSKPSFDPENFLDIDYLAHYRSTSRNDVQSLIRVDSIIDGLNDDDDDNDDNDDNSVEDNTRDDRQRRRGTDLHNILSEIIIPDDIDTALASASRLYGYDNTASDTYAQTIRRAISPEIARRWFNAENDVSTEVSFFVPVDNDAPDNMGFTKRIDRLVVRPDGTADVVDFKFTTEETDCHRRQVAGYVKYVRRMLPNLKVNGYLWYIDLDKVVRVD